ncbi:brachyurin-like isoform X2 [Cylas formicarius]|uniref:brachyurin-like isoform X2 n=1 Tax=Cylas formicarius TaxID=197179 RepID=UPI002958C925|nr:brachyurin-like isoform X2 [Cylas formicarius]
MGGTVLVVILLLGFRVDSANSEIRVPHLAFPKDGLDSFSPRIVGGRTATPHAYPYQALLFAYITSDSYLCSGSLISSNFVLTAAHCVKDASYALVHLGVHNMSSTEPSQTAYNSSMFIIHERWNEAEMMNDIALIKLPSPATLNENIATIKITSAKDTYEGDIARVTGWGLTANGATSSVLKYADVIVMSNQECATFDLYRNHIVASHICTSGAGNVGTCNGDSGGPLVFNGAQIGIVSFGYSGCTMSKPSVYTRLTEFADWIKTNSDIAANSTSNPTNNSDRKISSANFVLIAAALTLYLGDNMISVLILLS